MSDPSPHQYLFHNLLLLNEFVPGNGDFQKCIKGDTFVKPNRTAFDHVLFYLCTCYDSARYSSKIPWPILDRSQERVFRQNTVAFIKDILKEVPEARIPAFSPSFVATPGGDRFAKFMWKFSLLVLKTVVERDSDYPVLNYPTRGLHLLEKITLEDLTQLRTDCKNLCQFLVDASHQAVKLESIVLKQELELKSLQSLLADLVQGLEHCPLSDEEKSLLLSTDKEKYFAVIKKWQDHVTRETEKAKSLLKDLKERSCAVTNCYESVKLFMDSKTMPTVLDGTHFPSALKDSTGNLHIARVLSEGATAASALLKTLSVFGGFQSLEHVYPALVEMRKQLQGVEESMVQTKSDYIALISECSENAQNIVSSERGVGHEYSPKGSLRVGQELLQNAQMSTPPLLFNVQEHQTDSLESPPIEVAVRRKNAQLRARSSKDTSVVHAPKPTQAAAAAACTPKTSQFGSGLSLRKLPCNSSRKDLVILKDSSLNSVLDTPANFSVQNLSSSTVCKLATKVSSGIEEPREFEFENPTSRSSGQDTAMRIVTKSLASVALFKEDNDETEAKQISVEEKVKRSALPRILRESSSDDKTFEDTKSVEDLQMKSFIKPDSAECVQEKSKLLPVNLLSKRKSDMFPKASTGVEDFSVPKSELQHSLTDHAGKILESKESPSCSFPSKSLLLEGNQNLKHIATPKIGISSTLGLNSTFDSPQSCLGIFSPSGNDSFFCNDNSMSNFTSAVPECEFDDDISPSGRVSLCSLSVHSSEEPILLKEKPVQSETRSRRKSLQAIINRYRDLVASSKANEPILHSPPTSPISDVSNEDVDLDKDLDVNLGDLNIA